jgi:glycyl-tRNA synthetase
MPVNDMEKLVSLCRRRGFIFQSSEIYGGINGFWDYGPLGVELKKNVKDAWWQDMVRNPPPGPDGQEISMVGVDCALIMNPKVWEASGHVGGFADPMVDCKESKKRYRADQLFVVKERDDSATNPFFAFQGTDPESEMQAHKRMQKHKKLQGPLSTNQFHVTPLTDIPTKEYHRIFGPDAKEAGTLTEPRSFNLMFKTYVGASEDSSSVAYLRPETAQGIFVNFKNVLDSTRLKLPFGIAQVGKAFRNEINPRNYTFRSREFEQMEIEFFCHPDESMKWYEYWRDLRKNWYTKLGILSERLVPREQTGKELAFYSRATTDIEYLFPFATEPQELEGVAHRSDYDLQQHMKHSGKDLTYFDELLWQTADKSPYGGDKKKEQEAKSKMPYRFVPHVIEPSAGADRFTLAVLCEAYTEDKVADASGKEEERLVMKFHPRLAPIKAAILPLVNKEGMPEIAEKLYRELKQDFNVFYDDGGAIGRRYRRQDEAGTPYCITIDGETLQNQSVTIRDRDTLQQRRVQISEIAGEIRAALRS